jgi:hypothetical protein
MKKLIYLVIFCLIATGATAARLVCDPPGPCGSAGLPACPVKAEIFEDGISIATDVALEPDMSISYDLVSMPVGEHTYTAIYYDELGRVSVPSNPYVLLETVKPPSNLKGAP